MNAQPQQHQPQCADTGVLCPHSHRAGPCPKACTAPERCLAWGLGAASSQRPPLRTTLAASVLHVAVALLATAALFLIVKTAAGA